MPPAPTTGVHYDAIYLKHDTGLGHPECASRYQAVIDALDSADFPMLQLEGKTAELDDILLCHESWYHDIVRMDVDQLADVLRTGDTAICPDSYDVVMKATGAVLTAVDAILEGKVKNAFCAIRPPGHHASAGRGMGFCIFNHVAIAAKHLQERHGLNRIAILDWDVHHGNGTQDIFYQDGTVFYASSHEENIFPYTGDADEIGVGDGLGTTLNLPVPAGAGGESILPAWEEKIGSALRQFKPQAIIISAGFDARENDPIGMLNLTDNDFSTLTKMVKSWADELCEGRVLSVLEGGYQPEGLAKAVLAHVRALSGQS
ncbi:acetoin utilization protein [Oceaniferula spumae]|uniref:Acetoin utilization protein n=1 Tax=Oceaniferula spumae TaxID=2979115 RepID=A0AAT9FJ75_9BACT